MLEAAEWYIKASLAVAVGLALLSQAEDVVAAWRQTKLREGHERRLAARCAACDAHRTIEDMVRRLAAGEKLHASAEIGADGVDALVLLWEATHAVCFTEDDEPVEPLDPAEVVEAAERLLRGEGRGG